MVKNSISDDVGFTSFSLFVIVEIQKTDKFNLITQSGRRFFYAKNAGSFYRTWFTYECNRE